MSAAARLFAAVLLLQTTGARDSRPLPDPQPFFEAEGARLYLPRCEALLAAAS